MEWISLILAGCFEIFGLMMMNIFRTTKNIKIVVLIIFAFSMSFFFLSYAMQTLPMGLAYAIWTGIGGAGGALIGMLLYGESKDIKRISFIALIIISVIGLKLSA